jgi:hypothetical protein
MRQAADLVSRIVVCCLAFWGLLTLVILLGGCGGPGDAPDDTDKPTVVYVVVASPTPTPAPTPTPYATPTVAAPSGRGNGLWRALPSEIPSGEPHYSENQR